MLEERGKEQWKQIGSDNVVSKGETVVIYAACEMSTWKVTVYRRAAVMFGQKRYFVASSMALLDGAWRYVLEPWPEDLHDLPGVVVHYNEEYIQVRDALQKAQVAIERKAVGLFFVNWLLGFLFSHAKLSVNERYGIHPVTVTEQSVLIERALFLSLLSLLVLSPATGIPIAALLPIIAIILADLIIRSNRLFKGGVLQYGFCEWLFRRLPK